MRAARFHSASGCAGEAEPGLDCDPDRHGILHQTSAQPRPADTATPKPEQ